MQLTTADPAQTPTPRSPYPGDASTATVGPAGRDDPPPAPSDALAWAEKHPGLARALDIVTVGAKAAVLACAVDAAINHASPRLRGKAIRTRALGYTAGLFVVPVLWRLLPDRGPYPRGLDLAVTVPLLLDAGGNALNLYEQARIDDLVHVANGAIVSGVAGSLFGRNVDEPWQAAVAGAGVAITAETGWEIAEYLAWRLGADGMDLTYEDSMDDLAESAIGAILGGIFTWLRLPRSAEVRRRAGWRQAIGGWRPGTAAAPAR